MATLKELRDERLRKLEILKSAGINPYPASSTRTHTASEVIQKFESLHETQVTVTGRITSTRKFGKIAFFVLKDASATIQLFLKHDTMLEADPARSEIAFSQINLLDPGDFIEATGKVVKTQTGEISLEVTKIRVLTKSLRSLPTEQEGFTDKEQRLRRRYVDTNVNKDVYDRFIRRSHFWQATRDFLNQENFVEINTPVLEHTTGGADANPFITHMDALDQDFYLRISHELPLKRLIGGGYERVYDIGPRFRNENYSDEHLPEHVAMEFYAAYMDYEQGMVFTEAMLKHIIKSTWGKLNFSINGKDVNLDQQWPRISYADIMRDRFNIDVFNPDNNQLKDILKQHKAYVTEDMNVNRALDGVWKIIRANEAGPFWLIHEPIAISPLAKVHPDDPRVSQRVHPIIGGSELGNGFSELNDPLDQLHRFLEQQAMRDAGDDEAMMLDIDYVEMLEYGMPPTFGWGHSERLFWLFEGVTAREGVIFPQLRNEVDDVTRSVYPEVYNAKKSVKPKKVTSERSQDFTKRIVAVVNKELEAWQVANAVAHMAAIIGNEVSKEQLVSGEVFITNDGEALPRNAQHPIIIKRADEKELHKLYEKVQHAQIPYHIFIKEMQDTTNDQEITELVQNQQLSDISFYGVAFLALNDKADDLTKSFQLFR